MSMAQDYDCDMPNDERSVIMDTASGVIGWEGGKRFHNKTLYSFKFDGDDVFYRCGETDPQVNRGEQVSFSYTVDGKGNHMVDIDSIKRVAPEPKAAPAPSGGKAAGGNANPYHEREDSRQRIISYQAATNTAVAIASTAVANGMLKLGAQAKQLDNFVAIVTKLADQLVVQYTNAPAHIDTLLAKVVQENQAAEAVDGGMDDD